MLPLMITRLTFNEAPTIAFGGASFGNVGSYEKIQGRAFGELDPANPLNAVITDITLAPRNARGMVEYAVDFYILRPVESIARQPSDGVRRNESRQQDDLSAAELSLPSTRTLSAKQRSVRAGRCGNWIADAPGQHDRLDRMGRDGTSGRWPDDFDRADRRD